jgi:outer membrane lipoprotein-sorting protein
MTTPKTPVRPLSLALTRRAVLQSSLAASLAATALAFPATALASDDLLKKVDEATNKWKTLDQHYNIVTQKKGSDPTKLVLRMRMKFDGTNNLQLTEISEPADMKGTKVLVTSPTQMYIYLPAMKKIRRIASHVTDQPFLGTALSAEDMSITRLAKYYSAKTGSDDGTHVNLILTGKSDEAPYPKMEMKVEKARWLPLEIKKYNAAGKLIKTEKREEYNCSEGFCAPKKMTFVNHAIDMATVLVLTSSKVNAPIEDDLFSKRTLMRG